MRRTTLAALAIVPLLAAAGCGGDDADDETSADAPAGAGTTVAPSDAPDGTTPTDEGDDDEDAACPEETTMSLSGTDVADGDVDVTWALADGGPDVLNGDDQGLIVGLSSFEFPEDPQFGIEVPIDNTGLPEGDVFLSVQVYNPSATLAAGQRFIDQTAFDAGEDPTADGKILFVSAWAGSERLGPLGDVEVTITDITLEQICGTVTTTGTETDLQSLAGVEATFVADRIEYLDGDIPEGAGEAGPTG